jgi:hypothetical protein
VLDASAESPTWSRWLVQGISLRSIEIDKKVMMSVVHPSGIYAFDMDRADDEVFNPDTGLLEMVPIRWLLETNTQGANRAHDAWANLQQANATLGNFQGAMRYGIRGRDVNGMPVQVEKVVRAELDPEPVVLAEYDRDDFLLVRKTMKEWFFFAGSVDTTVDDVTTSEFFSGQLSQVQYRYTPVTVNVGYEYGSVETFEYGSSTVLGATTDSGVPKPYVDIGRP